MADLNSESMAADDKENSYIIGDLLWAKIGHYPYWPCMVSFDPLDGSYVKKKTVRGVETVIYHVQYFGKQIQHGWTLPGLIFPFEGEGKYHANRKKLVKEAASPSLKKKVAAKYFVPTGIHEAWIIAVREAEDALEYEIHERYTSFVFKYDINFKKSKSSSQETVQKGPSKKKKKKNKGLNKKPLKALEIYGNGEDLCKICEKGNVDLTCLGNCAQQFHKECLGLINVPENFKCNYCEGGVCTCFACKKSDTSTFKCSKCKYHYHEECFKKFHCANFEKKICSYHVCLSCYNASCPRNMSSKGPFISCIRCPSTFHATLQCTPLGSVILSSTTMICPEHYLGKNRVSPQMSLNITYCALCSTGGELFCCETCPIAYHISCFGTDPAGDFYCLDCQKRKYLYAGMVIWVKTGQYRWWPAQALSIEDVPENVRSKDHYDGEFPVQYFGTDEYFWTHRGRVIPYTEHHKNIKSQMSSKPCKLNGYFKLSLEEAAEAFDNYHNLQKMLNVKEHSDAYKHIRVNRAIPPATFVNSNGSAREEHNCDCNKKNMTCGPNSGCLNRDMMVECPSYCNVGDRCENQKFQKRQYAKVQQFKTENCGWGLKSSEIINKGDFVIEYVGEVITHDEYERRAAEMQEKNIPNYYFLYLDARRMIDAGPQGNLSRFINHSCDPNCEMSKWSVNGDSRIGIFAIKQISVGEELTFNYQSDSVEFSQRCFCGAKNCQGFIGRNGEKHKAKKLKSK